MIRFKHSLIAAAFGTALVFAPWAAMAEPGSQSPAGMQQGAAADVDDATLDRFVVAYADIQALQREFATELEQVESQEEAAALQQATQQKMVEAVQESGLSVPEYNTVVQALDQDPALREKVESKIE
ncbi:MAG: DUF4168 domain-containing protein [Gammaproteobacteria bacterium]|nr:DUF4168 domain-containing protein [Gammaproteobacteria bacterium]